MQSFDGYSQPKDKIINALHYYNGNRDTQFRYALLDSEDKYLGDIDTIVPGGEITQSSFAEIKRSLSFEIKDRGNINWLAERVQPFCMLKVNSDWIDIPLGIFIPVSPTRQEKNMKVYREVTCYDGLYVLVEDKFDDWYTIPAGTNYVTAVVNILDTVNIHKYKIEQIDKVLPVAKVFPPGKSKLTAINELLGEITFTELWSNELGYYTSSKYKLPSERAIEYDYLTDKKSIIKSGTKEELDLFHVPNKIIRVVANAETSPLKSVKVNDNINSPTSFYNRKRWIVDYEEINNIADQESLNLLTEKVLYEKSQIYGYVDFPTSINPFHSYMDIIKLQHSALSISAKFEETSWTMPLQADGTMTHQIRRVI